MNFGEIPRLSRNGNLALANKSDPYHNIPAEEFLKAIYFTFFFFSNLHAADIVISAEKISKKITSSTNNITYLSENDIQNHGWSTLSEALAAQPGVYITGFGTVSNVASVRLNGLQRGYSKIIIDEIEYNDPTDIDNSFQINQLDLTNIQSIEILKGSQSTIYGSDSLGGVIKITTKKSASTQNSLKISHASYNTNAVSYSSSSKNASFSTSYLDSSGISSYKPKSGEFAERDSYSKISFGGNLKKKIDDLTLKFQTHFLKSSTEIDDYKADRVEDDLSNFELKNYSLLAEKRIFNDRINSSLGFTQTFIHRNARGKYPTKNFGREDKLHLNLNHYYNDIVTNLYGVEIQKLKANDTFDFSTQTSKKNHNVQAFVASSVNLKTFNLDLSTRFEDHSNFDQKITYKAGISKNIDAITLSSNFATGYKSPTLYQLNAGNSNLELKPIDSKYTDIAFKYNSSYFHYNFIIFQYDFKNQIDYDNSNSKYINISKTQVLGIENNFAVNSNHVSFNFNSTINHSKNKETGKYLERSPRLMLKSTLNFHGNTEWLIESIYIGKRNDSGTLPSYSLYNLSANYQNFKLAVNNILNKDYEDIRSYSTYGRNFEVSYKIDL